LLLQLENITKTYQCGNDFHNALSNINLSFPDTGLVVIKGMSGSGKTTLLNIASLLDDPTIGKVVFKGENALKWKKSRRNLYYQYDVSFLFQDYQLIEDETVIYNVACPLLIQGKRKSFAYRQAELLLSKIGFQKDISVRKVSTLSGGEKQRVCLLRALITSPKIIFADEPTGALDSVNARNLCTILKRVSEKKLVIVVTHETCLFEEQADRLIEIDEGKVINDKTFKRNEAIIPYVSSKKSNQTSFVLYETKKNLLHKHRKNILPIISLVFSITFLLLILGFNCSAPKVLKTESNKMLNLGVSLISYVETNKIPGSSFSLVKTSRPSEEQIKAYLNGKSYYITANNYSAILPETPNITFENHQCENLRYLPLYSFKDEYVDNSLLCLGRMPSDYISEVIINQQCCDYLKAISSVDPVGKYLSINVITETEFETVDGKFMSDSFVFQRKVKVTGVVKETKLLNYPRIYYSYSALEDYLCITYLNNLSSYLGRQYSWYERIKQAKNNEPLSCYSNYLFLKDKDYLNSSKKDIEEKPETYLITNASWEMEKTTLELSNAISLGLNIFLGFAIFGAVTILILSTISAYLSDKKKIAIWMSQGLETESIYGLYAFQNIIISLLSLGISIGISIGMSFLLNTIFTNSFSISSLISIPFASLLGIRYFLPIILVFSLILLPFLITYIPISISGKTSVREELKNGD